MNGFGMNLKPKSVQDYEYLAQTLIDLERIGTKALERGDAATETEAATAGAKVLAKLRGKPGGFEAVAALLEKHGRTEQAAFIRKLPTE